MSSAAAIKHSFYEKFKINLNRDYYVKDVDGLVFFTIDESGNVDNLFHLPLKSVDSLPNIVEWIKNEFISNTTKKLKYLVQSSLISTVNQLLKDEKRIDVVSYSFYPHSGVELFYSVKRKKVKASNLVKSSEVKSDTSKIKKILIVDDSQVIRKILTKSISAIDGHEVIEEISNPSHVFEAIKKHRPDAMTLDINMPEMSGVDVLRKLNDLNLLIPTIVITSLNIKEAPEVLTALELGAFDYLQKPDLGNISDFNKSLEEKLSIAANSKNVTKKNREHIKVSNNDANFISNSLIAIGASTGGTQAIGHILEDFPAKVPPIVIVQHIPPVFSKAFADSLNRVCKFNVKEAEDGDELLDNNAYVAPGGKQMKIKKRGKKYYIQITDDEKMSGHSPSVDYLFLSIAETYEHNLSAVILTGMGSDGAKGCKKLVEKGYHVIGQDEESSVVYGMPRKAFENGGVSEQASLSSIAGKVAKILKKGK